MSYHNTTSTNQSATNAQGQVAPAGYHYMPDGSLMLNTEHDRLYGEKTIGFNLNTSDIKATGEIRRFSVSGDEGAVFSIEIYDDAAGSPTLPRNYYNFTTKTWSSTKSRLSNVELKGIYNFSVAFPTIEFTDATCDTNTNTTVNKNDDGGKVVVGMTVTGSGIPVDPATTVATVASNHTSFTISAAATSSLTNTPLTFAGIRKYTIDVYAETVGNVSTKHPAYLEVRNIDDTINLNKSSGSNSSLLRKIIYQDIKKNLRLSCIAPSLTNASTDVTVGSVSGDIIHTTVASPLDKIAIGDKITGTGALASSHILVTDIDPNNNDPNEVKVNQTCSIGSGVTLTYTPAFNGMIPNDITGFYGSNPQLFQVSSGESFKKGFSITCTAPAGRTLSASRLPTINDLCAYTTVTFESSALALEGEDVTGSTYYRWPITNIAKLQEGMILDPARTDGAGAVGVNTTTPATISKYTTTKTILESTEGEYQTEVNEVTVEDVRVNGVDSYNNSVTAIDRNGVITTQKGNIIFNVQQADALKSDADVRVFGYGTGKIKALTGIDVAISDIVITPTQVSTTTSAAVYNSTTIGLDEVQNISAGMTIRGIGVDTSSAIPTVSVKAAATGAANITASAAQTIEDNQTLYFDGASNVLTITGVIEISNMNINDTTLYFDVEKFIGVN